MSKRMLEALARSSEPHTARARPSRATASSATAGSSSSRIALSACLLCGQMLTATEALLHDCKGVDDLAWLTRSVGSPMPGNSLADDVESVPDMNTSGSESEADVESNAESVAEFFNSIAERFGDHPADTVAGYFEDVPADLNECFFNHETKNPAAEQQHQPGQVPDLPAGADQGASAKRRRWKK